MSVVVHLRGRVPRTFSGTKRAECEPMPVGAADARALTVAHREAGDLVYTVDRVTCLPCLLKYRGNAARDYAETKSRIEDRIAALGSP